MAVLSDTVSMGINTVCQLERIKFSILIFCSYQYRIIRWPGKCSFTIDFDVDGFLSPLQILQNELVLVISVNRDLEFWFVFWAEAEAAS